MLLLYAEHFDNRTCNSDFYELLWYLEFLTALKQKNPLQLIN